jgi:hypothetical protein
MPAPLPITPALRLHTPLLVGLTPGTGLISDAELSPSARRAVDEIDRTLPFTAVKAGVILVRRGQRTLDQALSNNGPGPLDYERFLCCLGKLERTKGCKRFLAGLDTRHDTDGRDAIAWESANSGIRIVYHVATLIAAPEAVRSPQTPLPEAPVQADRKNTPTGASRAPPRQVTGSTSDRSLPVDGGASAASARPAAAAAADSAVAAAPRLAGRSVSAGQLLPTDGAARQAKARLNHRKRHVGNDPVLVVWSQDGAGGLDIRDIKSQVAAVVILLQPAGPLLTRVTVLCRDGPVSSSGGTRFDTPAVMPFGPLGPLTGLGPLAKAFCRETRSRAQRRLIRRLRDPAGNDTSSQQPRDAAGAAAASAAAADAGADAGAAADVEKVLRECGEYASGSRLPMTVPLLASTGHWPDATSVVVVEWAVARLVRAVVMAADAAVRASATGRAHSSHAHAGVDSLCGAADRRAAVQKAVSRLYKAAASKQPSEM